MNIKDALRQLVDVTRLIDAHECGELYNELQSALYVAGEALHEADTNKPAVTVDSPEFRELLCDVYKRPKFDFKNPNEETKALIAHIDAHVAEAVAAEREDCAQIAERHYAKDAFRFELGVQAASAIRARA